jgi:hypothetical protein
MDDMISRAALLKSLNEQAPKPTTDDLYTVNLCIINAPTIDAIPVEWLERTKENYIAVATVLKMWQKEQEAQDG